MNFRQKYENRTIITISKIFIFSFCFIYSRASELFLSVFACCPSKFKQSKMIRIRGSKFGAFYVCYAKVVLINFQVLRIFFLNSFPFKNNTLLLYIYILSHHFNFCKTYNYSWKLVFLTHFFYAQFKNCWLAIN